jgi:hypothetical protein
MGMTYDLQCKRCGHTWTSARERPVVCPRCKSYSYQEPYIRPPKPRQAAQDAQGRPNGG